MKTFKIIPCFLKAVEFLNNLFLSCRKFMRGALNTDISKFKFVVWFITLCPRPNVFKVCWLYSPEIIAGISTNHPVLSLAWVGGWGVEHNMGNICYNIPMYRLIQFILPYLCPSSSSTHTHPVSPGFCRPFCHFCIHPPTFLNIEIIQHNRITFSNYSKLLKLGYIVQVRNTLV